MSAWLIESERFPCVELPLFFYRGIYKNFIMNLDRELYVSFLTLLLPSPHKAGALFMTNRLQVHVVEFVGYINWVIMREKDRGRERKEEMSLSISSDYISCARQSLIDQWHGSNEYVLERRKGNSLLLLSSYKLHHCN